MDYDVVVVGAGPGGSMTARTLAQEGASVLMVEKRPEIGMPVRCGEGTGVAGLKELGITPHPKFIAQEIYGDYLYSPDGTKVDMRTEEPNGYCLERRMFDKHLGILAAKAGAVVRTRTTATGLITENGTVKGVKLRHFDDEYDVKCNVVVGADGIEGRVGRWAGISNRTKLGEMTSNVQFELVGIEMEEPNVLEFYLGGKYAPGGYVWIFPKGPDVANVGLGIRKTKETALVYLKRFIAEHENLARGSVASIVVGGVPVQGPLEESVGNGVLLVGDSARHVDPLTGGGIYNAMHCGTLAAGVIGEALAAGNFSKEFLQKYHELWWKEVGEGLMRSLRVKEIIEKLSDDDLNKIAKFMQGMKFGEIDIKEASSIVTQFPPEFAEFVQSLL
ncbi:NAD(P)/FAD-dependent oxidoreductase [archaeon]|nr:NAD(P)/FAD-dependent oxidoreductase [archaeon]